MKTRQKQTNGFALVATLLMMVLLTIIAVGMLSLSSVTIRTESQISARDEAQANARMALMIAIGKLQKQMGPDQRISANAEILDVPGSFDVSQKHWMGSWDSWIAGTIPSDVNPNYPSAASHEQTIGSQPDVSMSPAFTNKNGHFRSWLVSLNPESAADLSKVTESLTVNLTPNNTDTSITLVGEGTLGERAASEDLVTVPLLSQVNQSGDVSGRYGYWVGDENQKARLLHDSYQDETLSNADKIFRRQAPGSTGTSVATGLGALSNDFEISRLASIGSLDLLTGATGNPSHKNFHAASVYSRGVLADVREGGLKRDLSTILERTISTADSSSEFMLYEFDDPRFADRSNSRVPIQDLAAYYQLYQDDASWSEGKRGGVTYNSTALPNSIQVTSPNYDGGNENRLKFQGEYTGLYKQPAIAKVQFLLAIGAQEVTADERAAILALSEARDAQNAQRASEPNPKVTAFNKSLIQPMRDSDTHKLLLGIMPVITLWNPNNVPMVMDNSQVLRFNTPPFALRWRKYREAGGVKDYRYFNLNYAMGGSSMGAGEASWGQANVINYRFARNSAIVFEPGEVKMFSAPSSAGGTLELIADVAKFRDSLIDPVNTWDPNGLFLVPRVTPQGGWANEAPDAYNFNFTGGSDPREHPVFGQNDRISLEIVSEKSTNDQGDGRRVTIRSEVLGAAFNLSMTDEGFFRGLTGVEFFRNFQMLSRHGGEFLHRSQQPQIEIDQAIFNQELFNPAFPDGSGIINFQNRTNAIPCANIINASAAGDAIGVIDFSLNYGCEIGLNSGGGFSAGRRIASRPFLHAGLNAAPLMDQADTASLYDYGWDWQLNMINNIEDSVIQGEPATGRGYFGGGYTIEAGTTHVVQREIPVLPPISIASLSHAHLGGFSLARNNNIGQNPATDNFATTAWDRTAYNRVRLPLGIDYQQPTATGQGGLAPHVVQAIGNSYAHPNIPANKAFSFKTRQLDGQEAPVNAPFVDHSYLANKALWDDYFFSSITPQPASVLLYGGVAKTAQQVATDFFDNGGVLPNRRLKAYKEGMDSDRLNNLFTEYSNYTNGFADKIASYLTVEGSFNVNSTSVEAWKILLSSLRGKPSVYLESGTTPSDSTLTNTVVGFGSLPNATPIASGSIVGPNAPENQWKAGRELSNDEIDALAKAIVRQVKLRGPFLSLSEFINRRLDDSSETLAVEMAVKGALQAALDDPGDPSDLVNRPPVTINAQFREAGRILDAETASTTFPFNAAAKGPVAYGSAAYVDQADILRGLAGQLTPRGDTFVVRAYGDSLSDSGKVLARAWCEAVVQRVPGYLDPSDEAHVKQAELTSEANKTFGRKLIIVRFRWLSGQEI